MVAEILNRLDRIERLLTSQDTVLSFAQAANYAGLSHSYLYQLTSRCEIPHSKPHGKKIYFSKRELDAWLLQNKVRSNAWFRPPDLVHFDHLIWTTLIDNDHPPGLGNLLEASSTGSLHRRNQEVIINHHQSSSSVSGWLRRSPLLARFQGPTKAV